MFEQLKAIKASIVYYVRQNKRLAADEQARAGTGEESKHEQHILENEIRIENLRYYYAQILMQIKEKTGEK